MRPVATWPMAVIIGVVLLLIDIACLLLVRASAMRSEIHFASQLWGQLHWPSSVVAQAFFPQPYPAHTSLPYAALASFWVVALLQWFALGWLIAKIVQIFRSGTRHAL